MKYEEISVIVIVVFALVCLVLQQVEVLSNQIARTLDSLGKVRDAVKNLVQGRKERRDSKTLAQRPLTPKLPELGFQDGSNAEPGGDVSGAEVAPELPDEEHTT
ncbi:hypothetical protein OG453_38050 [Streptomyces sp. NBC_01381]|uniref:hypothetical protein n=1 Tax=Streptomyces sp. NBC_01381 TaxID=2903845 RepID=UPI0022513123|nr:hypothetical protein [Streptomyces sp. NBC_01381]MCX4672397.1 hypothetical protein [Streptomyces sp. NBC_01381]